MILKTWARVALVSVFCLVAYTARAQTDSAPTKDWNFLVFLNGKNSLDADATMNLKQMEGSGSTERMNIVVEWGSNSRPNVQRLYIEKSSDPSNVTSPVVNDRGAADMGSAAELVDFVTWASAKYPAKRTFLVVWDHGSGWHRVDNVTKIQDISLDEKTGHLITTEDLGAAMAQIKQVLGKNIDIYGSDACLMGMAEVADQMAGSVDYFVGSQDLEPGPGWPYPTFLAGWQANADASPRDVATLLTSEYVKAYNDDGIYGDSRVTLSAFDMAKLPAFLAAVKTYGAELASRPAGDRSLIVQSMASSKAFSFFPDYHDLADFADVLDTNKIHLASAAALRAAQADLVFANGQNEGPDTHGLSIWLPGDGYYFRSFGKRYMGLQFNRDTQWGDMLQSVLH